MAIQAIEMVKMAVRKTDPQKKLLDTCATAIFVTGTGHFFVGRFFSEGRFDHFYGSDGHETTHHSIEN